MWAAYSKPSEKRKNSTRVLLYAAFGLAVAINGVVQVHLIRPIIPLSADSDVSSQFHGWRELGKRLDSLIGRYPHEKGYFLIAERRTALAEAVFYSNKVEVGVNLIFPERYDFLGDTSCLEGKNALILVTNLYESTLATYQPHFDSLTAVELYRPQYRDEIIWDGSFYIVLGRGYSGRGPQFEARRS
jgi:hypothetical protein